MQTIMSLFDGKATCLLWWTHYDIWRTAIFDEWSFYFSTFFRRFSSDFVRDTLSFRYPRLRTRREYEKWKQSKKNVGEAKIQFFGTPKKKWRRKKTSTRGLVEHIRMCHFKHFTQKNHTCIDLGVILSSDRSLVIWQSSPGVNYIPLWSNYLVGHYC